MYVYTYVCMHVCERLSEYHAFPSKALYPHFIQHQENLASATESFLK